MIGDLDRRVVIVRIAASTVLDWFTFAAEGYPKFLDLPRINLPPGSRVLSVRDDWPTRTFQFLVYHPSFETVPEGMVPPDKTYELLTQRVHLP